MFAPPVAKLKVARSAPQRSTVVAPRLSNVWVEQPHLLQRSIDNQSMLGLLGAAREPARRVPPAPEDEADPASLSAQKAAPGVLWDFSQIPIFPPGRTNQHQEPFLPPLSGPTQTKLQIGPVNDPLEHEADRVADQVMRTTDADVSITAAPAQLNRKCAACEQDDEGPQELQMKPATIAVPQGGEAPDIVHDALRSPGQPLDPAPRAFSISQNPGNAIIARQWLGEIDESAHSATDFDTGELSDGPEEDTEDLAEDDENTDQGGEEEAVLQTKASPGARAAAPSSVVASLRAMKGRGQPLPTSVRSFFEPRFRLDFSRVRIHTDSQAARTAAQLSARAFTTGHRVFFGAGEYSPRTASGKRLLAHELAHVAQQTSPAVLMLKGKSPGKMKGGSKGSTSGSAAACTPVAHNHKPTGNWAAVQARLNPKCSMTASEILKAILSRKIPSLNSRSVVECFCAFLDPGDTLEAAKLGTMTSRGLSLAEKHVEHYLTGGAATFVEDVAAVVNNDAKVRHKLAARVSKHKQGSMRVEQSDYASEDFKFAFGAIDCFNWQVTSGGMVHVWFKDRYEWHPEDASRPSNCVHIAAVELKTSGAADYWMEGHAVLAMSAIRAP